MRFSLKRIKAAIIVGFMLFAIVVSGENVVATTNGTTITETSSETGIGENIGEETVIEDNAEALAELLERNEYLGNSYRKLEEKYQKEKDFSHAVIYVLIFVIAVLLVIQINVILFYRRKLDKNFENRFEERKEVSKIDTIEPQIGKVEKVEITKPEEKLEEEIPLKEETAKKETAKKEAVEEEKDNEDVTEETKNIVPRKKALKKKEPKKNIVKKVEIENDFEIFDFNDED